MSADREAAMKDLASLGRVSHRLAMIDSTDRLEQVLDKLLPRLLKRIGDHQQVTVDQEMKEIHEKIHSKLVEMLSHTMSRVRHETACRIPCRAILDLLLDATSPLTINLALAFLTVGLPRSSSTQELETFLPPLLKLLQTTTEDTTNTRSSNQIAHLLLRTIQQIVQTSEQTTVRTKKHKSQAQPHDSLSEAAQTIFTESPAALWDLMLDAILYRAIPTGNVPPPGMSQSGHERLANGASNTAAANWAAEMAPISRLVHFKLAILDFLSPTKRWGPFMGSSKLGIARTLALLVVASGDERPEVAQRARTYLKIHFDSYRGKEDTSEALGESDTLACGLLALTLGQNHADAIFDKYSHNVESLGLHRTRDTEQQRILSWKRRLVSESTAAAIASFVTTKVLEEQPRFLFTIPSTTAMCLVQLATLAIQKSLYTVINTQASGLSVLRAKPYIAASQLLNALCIRLATYYDANELSDALTAMAKCMTTVCAVLATASVPRGTTTGVQDGSIAVRDACYGALCSLARSRFALAQEGYIFNRGHHLESASVASETAALLFGCAANESETLRPRAVAALDALLAAYCRVYVPKKEDAATKVPVAENPWAVTQPPDQPLEQVDPIATRGRLIRALLPLIWAAGQSTQPKASRVAAARWSSDLLKALDLPNACHLLCYLAGDNDVTAASIALKGLGLKSDESHSEDEMLHPDFGELIDVIFVSVDDGLPSSSWRPRYWEFSWNGKVAAIRLGLECLLADLYGGSDESVETYLRILTETLSLFKAPDVGHGREAIDLLDECSTSFSNVLSTSQHSRLLIVGKNMSLGLEDVEKLALSVDSTKARRFLAEACGHLYEDPSVWQLDVADGGDVSLAEWIQRSHVRETLETCVEKLSALHRNVISAGEIHGSAYLGARCVRAFRLLATKSTIRNTEPEVTSCWVLSSKMLGALGEGIMHSDEVIGNAFADGLTIAMSYESPDAPILVEELFAGATSALLHLEKAVRMYGHGDHVDPIRVTRLAQAAGICLASTTSAAGFVSASTSQGSDSIDLGPARLQCASSLISLLGSMAFRKDEEVALAAGEALALYGDAYSPSDAVWSAETSDWPEDYDEDFALKLPPHQHVLYALLRMAVLSSSPHRKTSCAPALLAVVAHATKKVNIDPTTTSRSLTTELLRRLSEVQNAFLVLLADPKSKHLSRESCCIGLTACRGLVAASANSHELTDLTSDNLNNKLLRAFGQTTSFGGSAMMETAEQAAERRRVGGAVDGTDEASTLLEPFGGVEVEVGGTSGLGEAALGAYREMASAAVSLGRPDVLYALLMLSVSHPLWFSKTRKELYSSSVLLGENSSLGSRTNTAEIREALRPHLGRLLPRLLRACHDPNKQTRDQMSVLLTGLTGGGAESRLAITQNLLPTLDSLIDDASNKLWRARVGACGALTEIIVGRSWTELGGGTAILDDDDVLSKLRGANIGAGVRLLRLWRVAMRSLDDVRGAVRESGESLARGVRSLTLRLSDPSTAISASEGPAPKKEQILQYEREASAAAGTALRWLVKHGLNQPCAEGTGMCVSCLVSIVDVVRPTMLQPILPALIRSLLFAMSGLEPAALNFLQVRVAGQDSNPDSYNRLEGLRLQLAQRGPLASAVSKCLAFLPSVDSDTQKAVIPELDAALRLSAGFATRAATADAVSSLCHTCPNAFNFSGSSNTSPSVRLLRALYYASERERGQGAKDKMAHALGNLSALCPGASVRSLALRACERYSLSTGNNDDPAARRAAAAALRSIAVRASNQFADGGSTGIWCKSVLPVAFLGQKDSDAKVAALWKEVWEEGGGAANLSGVDDFDDVGSLLEEKLLPYLIKECIRALEDVSWSRRVNGSAAIADLCSIGVLSPSPRATQNRPTMNSASLTRAKRRAKASSDALKACIHVMMGPRLWVGKSEVVKATVKVACQWSAAAAAEDSSSAELYGWDGGDDPCPWRPIELGLVLESQENNGVFALAADDPLESEADQGPQPDQGETEEMGDEVSEVQIDFEAGDALLNQELDTMVLDSPEPGDKSYHGISFVWLGRALLNQAFPEPGRSNLLVAEEESLPYRASALQGFCDLLTSIGDTDQGKALKQRVYAMVAPQLLSIIDTEERGSGAKTSPVEPPLLVARSLACLGSCIWHGIGFQEDEPRNSQDWDVLKFAGLLALAGGNKQPAWTVREASAICLAELGSKCHIHALRKPSLISTMLDCATQALKDRKFWRVRLAGLKILSALVCRVGSTSEASTAFSARGTGHEAPDSQVRQLTLEALLPHKESIMSLARASLKDSEAQVTAMGSDIVSSIAWWP